MGKILRCGQSRAKAPSYENASRESSRAHRCRFTALSGLSDKRLAVDALERLRVGFWPAVGGFPDDHPVEFVIEDRLTKTLARRERFCDRIHIRVVRCQPPREIAFRIGLSKGLSGEKILRLAGHEMSCTNSIAQT